MIAWHRKIFSTLRNNILPLLLGLILLPQAHAASAPLRAEDVLRASATHYPKILESFAKRRAAEGAAISSLGAFDLVFSADSFSRVTGSWDGSVIEGKATQNIRQFGGTIYGGYKLSDGSFPVYEDVNFTNTLGEAKIGAVFSLLRDRAIDERRFNIAIAELGITQADLDVLLTQIGVQHRALGAYWKWVATGRKLEVYESLFQIAQDRQSGLEEQVREGAIARIFLTENRQNMTRREILATEAAREFQMAAANLSMYYRDANGERIIPTRDQLPREIPDVSIPDLDQVALPEQILERRPELGLLATELERARQTLALGENERKPRLDLRYELSRDFGNVAEGGSSRDSTDNVVGLRFSVPLQRRKAQGDIIKARAEIEALKQQRRQMRDQISVELRNIMVDLQTAIVLRSLASQEAQLAHTMEEAERERFDSGASDFFLVNIREETAANAEIRQYRAALQAHIARANYDAITVNTERLGLDDPAQY